MISRSLGIIESRLSCDLEKLKFAKFVQNEFEVAKHHEVETELTLRRFCMKFIDLLEFLKICRPLLPSCCRQ